MGNQSATLTYPQITATNSPKDLTPPNAALKTETENPLLKFQMENPHFKIEPENPVLKFEPENPVLKIQESPVLKIPIEEPECRVSLANVTAEMLNLPQTKIEYYICGPVLTCFIIFGILGNILCIRAFLNSRRRSAAAINAYLIVLAGWDLALVIASFVLYNLSVLIHGFVPVYGPYVRTYAVFFSAANASHTASIWCVLAMAAERYFALVYPFRHRRATLDHGTRARRTLICLSILSILISIPKYFEVRLDECMEIDSGTNVTYVTSSDLRRNQVYSIVYIVIGGLLFHSLTPFSLLVILSIRVIIEVRRGDVMHRQISVRRSKQITLTDPRPGPGPDSDPDPDPPSLITSGRHRRADKNSNKILSIPKNPKIDTDRSSEHKAHEILPLAVVAKFFICHTLPTVLDIFERLTSEENFEGPVIDLLVDISNALVVMNSSVNFALYAACSQHFRRRIVSIWRSIFYCDRDDFDEFDSRRSSAFMPSFKKSDVVLCTSEKLVSRSDQ